MKICCPFSGGIILGSYCSISYGSLVIALICLFVLLICSLLLSHKKLALPISVSAYSLLFFFGVVKISLDNETLLENNISHFVNAGAISKIKGSITDLPVRKEQSIRFVIEAESMYVGNRFHRVTGEVLVSCRANSVPRNMFDTLVFGRMLTLEGELTQAGSARNPGEFDSKRYLQMNDIYAKLFVDHIDTTAYGSIAASNVQVRYVYPVRRSLAQRIDELTQGEEASFLKGLIIGERSEIPAEVKTAFINTGVMHIIAVSGLHVTLVVMILVIIFQTLRVPELARYLIIIVLLIYYNFLTGGAASVTRSVIMGIVFLAGKLLQHKVDMYNVLGFSALIILLIDAKQVFQPGFQLSFVAVFALVYLYPKIYRLKDLLPEKLRENSIVVMLFASIAVSLAAGIGTLPFTSIYFGKISIISFVANMIIVPLSNVILTLGMVAVGISYCSMWIGSVYAAVTSLLTTVLLKLVGWFGSLQFSYAESHFDLSAAFLFYAVVYTIVNMDQAYIRKYYAGGILVLANIALYASLWNDVAAQQRLRVTFLDVGQGDAIFIEFPDGNIMLVDAGPISRSYDAGSRFITPFLKKKGISRINDIVISHPHSDHMGGMPSLLKSFRIDNIIDAGSEIANPLYNEYRHLVDSLKIPHPHCSSGDIIHLGDRIRIYVLAPSGEFLKSVAGHHSNLNNQSVILKIVYGTTSLLLPGDAEREEEARARSTYGNFLQSSLLKSGHHGSKTSSTEYFLDAVQPEQVVISVGVRNKFHHPSAIILDRYREKGYTYYRTDEQGAVVMESDGSSWQYIDWR